MHLSGKFEVCFIWVQPLLPSSAIIPIFVVCFYCSNFLSPRGSFSPCIGSGNMFPDYFLPMVHGFFLVLRVRHGELDYFAICIV